MSQKLRGLVGQGMRAGRKSKSPVARTYLPGSYTFRVTTPGIYRFQLWGGGGAANHASNGGGGSAFVQADRALGAGALVAVVVGAGALGSDGGDTTLKFQTGEVVTAGGGKISGAAGIGAGSNLDTIYNGGAGGVAGSGAAGSGPGGGAGGAATSLGGGGGAGGSAAYPGGAGSAQVAVRSGGFPGGGAGDASPYGPNGGDGYVVITQIRLSP